MGNQLSYFSSTVNERQVAKLNPENKETIIFELEALAVLVGCANLLPLGSISSNDRLVVFVDNEAVLSRLISGRGGGAIDNAIFQKVFMWEHDNRVLAWYERVPSAANVADSPSRGDVSGLDGKLEFRRCR